MYWGALQELALSELRSFLERPTEEGLRVVELEDDLGRGVVTTRCFQKAEKVLEYRGETIDLKTACQRELEHQITLGPGGYLYFFRFKDKSLW